MPELKSRLQPPRQGCQKALQYLNIYFKVRRQLKQYRPQLAGASQRLNRRKKARNEVLGPLQPLDVGNDLVSLDREAKTFAAVGHPLGQRRLLHQLAEREVHLHGIELRRVVA